MIVDDHDLFRVGLAELLSAAHDIEVTGQASGGRMAVRLARELCPDVVLMDLGMPDLDGPGVMRAILERDPTARVVVLTAASGDEDVSAALRAGACGYLVKGTPIASVVGAVRAASEGAAWLSPHAAEVVFTAMRRSPSPHEANSDPTQLLSKRELDVLRLLARGMDNDAIASSLYISPLTAKSHISHILGKLGLPSRVQAAIYAVRRGLDED